MSNTQEMEGIPTKEKAKNKATQIRKRLPNAIVIVIGNNPPYTVQVTIPDYLESDRYMGVTEETRSFPLSDIRSGILGFLDFIAKYESNGNYNAYYGSAGNTNAPTFTSMTVKQVLAWQKDRKFSACGKYQIIRATLIGLIKSLKIADSAIFDNHLQDKMGIKLLENRGLHKFLTGKMKRDDFALSVAREWAALPGVKLPYKKNSVYDGDGVNHALVVVSTYLEAIETLKKQTNI